MVLPDFENKYYLKDNESNYTLRNHKSCQKPWHGQRQKFKSVLRNLHDVEMGHRLWAYSLASASASYFTSALIITLSSLFSTTTLSNGNSYKFYSRVKAIFSAVTTLGLTTTVA